MGEVLVAQFKSLIVGLLVVAAALSFAFGQVDAAREATRAVLQVRDPGLAGWTAIACAAVAPLVIVQGARLLRRLGAGVR